jgi:predicted TIM-barrel fold metal-dependent hydrolase
VDDVAAHGTAGYPIADADNHLYETRDAFTRYLPPERADMIRFVEIEGRVTLVVKEKLAFILPNPTLEKVPPPGYYDDIDNKPRIIVSPPEFFEPEPRLRWMRETGIDRAVLFPTLGLSLEERLRGDTEGRHVMVHAYNRWLLDQWTFDYEGALFPAPLVTLSILDQAIAELEWVVDHGARIIYVQPGFVTTDRGRKSMALPEFDPFWAKVVEAGVVVGMHSGDGGQDRYVNEWEGTPDAEVEHFKQRSKGSMAFRMFVMGNGYERITGDLVASLVCHGLLSRFPELQILPAEQGTGWVRPTITRLGEVYAAGRPYFEEDPVEQVKRNVKVHLFRDRDPVELTRLVGADAAVFGSDFPHPEGQANPLDFADHLVGLPEADIAKVMVGNLDRILGTDHGAAAGTATSERARA